MTTVTRVVRVENPRGGSTYSTENCAARGRPPQQCPTAREPHPSHPPYAVKYASCPEYGSKNSRPSSETATVHLNGRLAGAAREPVHNSDSGVGMDAGNATSSVCARGRYERTSHAQAHLPASPSEQTGAHPLPNGVSCNTHHPHPSNNHPTDWQRAHACVTAHLAI